MSWKQQFQTVSHLLLTLKLSQWERIIQLFFINNPVFQCVSRFPGFEIVQKHWICTGLLADDTISTNGVLLCIFPMQILLQVLNLLKLPVLTGIDLHYRDLVSSLTYFFSLVTLVFWMLTCHLSFSHYTNFNWLWAKAASQAGLLISLLLFVSHW